MIRIAIVEDEDSYVQVLTGYLKQYETEHSLSFQISVFHDGLDIVSEYKADYDIILLDIQMKHLDGMKTAEKIRELDEAVREAVAEGREPRQQVREQMQRTEREWVVNVPEKAIELEKTLGGD